MLFPILIAAGTQAPAPATKPLRSMTYSFAYATQSAQSHGTIQADVLGVTNDGGLLVRFSQTTASATSVTFAPAECEVYGNARVLCQKQGALSSFENELAHLLGRNFVNGEAIDDKNHWRLTGDDSSGTLVDDFTITSNDNGILSINETRNFTANGITTRHIATLTYDLTKTVPTRVHYTDAPEGKPNIRLTADLTLLSDSMKP